MKNILFKKMFMAVVLITLLPAIGCKKYTEVQPVSFYSLETAFSNPGNAFLALIGAYDDLQGDGGYGSIVSLYFPNDTDESYTGTGVTTPRGQIARYQVNLVNPNTSQAFRQFYRGIERANLCIEQIPLMSQYDNGTDAEKKELRRMYGEVLTLRAQYYFELIRNWGDVPAPMIPSYRQTNLFIEASNRDSTYDKIINDLIIAKDLLPWRTEVIRNTRITKGAAKALLAKIALFRGGYSLRSNAQMERGSDHLKYYQIALDECADLMANRNQHTLNSSFESVWRNILSLRYDPSGEIIFEVGAGGINGNSDSRIGYYNGPSLNSQSRYGGTEAGMRMTPNYFYAFDSVDTRRDVTITMYAVPTSSNNKTLRRPGELTPGKFRRDWRVPLIPGTQNNLGINWSLIRFSDVLLMYAEAANEINGAPTPQAIAAFEEVRKRGYGKNAGLIGVTPTDKDGFFNAIVNERYLEFGEEGIRKYDLLRWNLLSTKIAEMRLKVRQIRDRVAPYTFVPQYVYYKNTGEELKFYTVADSVTGQPFWRPTQIPPDPASISSSTPRAGDLITKWVRVDWAQQLTSNVDGTTPDLNIARFFTPGKSELFPFDQSALDSYQGKLKQNPGY